MTLQFWRVFHQSTLFIVILTLWQQLSRISNECLPDQKEKISERVLYYLEVQTDYLHFDTQSLTLQISQCTLKGEPGLEGKKNQFFESHLTFGSK